MIFQNFKLACHSFGPTSTYLTVLYALKKNFLAVKSRMFDRLQNVG
jgi:hypothetical protein